MNEEEEQGFLGLFKQQMLKAWQPIPTLTKTIVLFLSLSLVFLGIGIPMFILATNIVQCKIRYDNQCTIGAPCALTFNVPTSIPAPVFVYYELTNFYQNHRLYANSISFYQLIGQNPSIQEISKTCQPIVKNSDLHTNVSIDGTPLVADAAANPCGLIAFTIFNDSFKLIAADGSQVQISNKSIAWPSDIQTFNYVNKSVVWLNYTEERVMNWMRLAAMPNFRKLWGRIDQDLAAGTYNLQIENNYDISGFEGTKSFVVSNSNFFGSKNEFLSISYIIVGSLCFLVGCVFLGRKIMKKKSKSF